MTLSVTLPGGGPDQGNVYASAMGASGFGSLLIRLGEEAARAAGFTRIALGSTLPVSRSIWPMVMQR